jgi:hypothetical protein
MILLDQVSTVQITEHWHICKDGDPAGLALYERHYSCYQYKDGRSRSLFCGPGFKIVLITSGCDALFVWRKFKSMDNQQGINCAVFRNESAHLSSGLILEAERVAECRWPGERLYTYVSPSAVKSQNPGYCFKRAGWKLCGTTKKGLLIFEKKCKGDA